MKRRDALKNTALLGGTALLSTSLVTLWQSCQTQQRIDWEPIFLSKDHAQLIAALVETILPTTDTPGGLEVKVDMFIDLIMAETYDEEGKENIVTAMNQFNEKCQKQFGGKFAELDQNQKQAFLQSEETNSPKFGAGVWGYGVGPQPEVGFYRSMKSMIIWGYCTSEEIGKNVLNYDPVPGDYKGCVPLVDIGRVWSL